MVIDAWTIPEETEEEKFWDEMGECEGYTGETCPNCGRVRVEHWGCGKDICEKCHWCLQDNDYFTNEFFRY